MKNKHFVMALAIVTVGAFVSALAQNNFINLPGVGWFTNSAQATTNVPLSLPAAQSAPVHDGEHYPTSGTFNSVLGKAVVTQHQDGDTVILMSTENAKEDHLKNKHSGGTHNLPGTLTLKLTRDASGVNIIGGEWAYNVSYTEVRHIENPEPGGEDHAEFLVQRGTLKGTISGGQVSLDGNGSVSAINSVQLAVNGGSLTFHATKSGSGSGQMSNLLDADTATGTLTLSF
jgi:hypothetical protein